MQCPSCTAEIDTEDFEVVICPECEAESEVAPDRLILIRLQDRSRRLPVGACSCDEDAEDEGEYIHGRVRDQSTRYYYGGH